MSFPARGAWIEIPTSRRTCRTIYRRSPQGERGLKLYRRQVLAFSQMSFPARGAWIEMETCLMPRYSVVSFPARGAWIEMIRDGRGARRGIVVPRKGSVD